MSSAIFSWLRHRRFLWLAVIGLSGCTLFPPSPYQQVQHPLTFSAMQDLPSPNFDPRPQGGVIDMLVIHYTGMESAQGALSRLRDPAARVSAHYVIDEEGIVSRLVDENARAWHAGKAAWRGETNINERSIGIELVNPGHEFGYRPFAEAQMTALIGLTLDILARHPIPPENIVGHADVAPTRKQDPGELFDWARLARAGIGRWPGEWEKEGYISAAGLGPVDITEAQNLLARIGYDIQVTGHRDPQTEKVLTAFQRHFRPRQVDGIADAETMMRLRDLAGGGERAAIS